MVMKIVGAVGLSLIVMQGSARAPQVRFTQAYALKAGEGVFAYSRISPDGTLLGYASEMRDPARGGRIVTTQTVVDLRTKQTLFTEPGIDAYFSVDGQRMIYLSQTGGGGGVTIRHTGSGALTRNVAPVSLGDYFSWAQRDGKELILTIQSNYYYLDGDRGVMPAGRVVSCEGIGIGERPLISKDGRRITTFVRGTVVIRNVTDCNGVIDTGLRGAKADFSFDGRYVAFHIPKESNTAYELVVVDLEKRTMRKVTTSLAGSSLFPSWTKDGRLSFRYDGDDYRGFMFAENVLSVPEQPLPVPGLRAASDVEWSTLFPETPRPAERTALVMIWAAWNSHAPDALASLQQARDQFRRDGADVRVMTAVEVSSRRADVARIRSHAQVTLPEIPLAPDRFTLTDAVNQIPATLLFRDGRLVDRRLGAQTAEQIGAWTRTQK